MAISSEHLSEEELLSKLTQAHRDVEVGALYVHWRNSESLYRVTGLAIIDATQEVGVLYKKESGTEVINSIIWVRALSSWLEKASVENVLVPRFQKIG